MCGYGSAEAVGKTCKIVQGAGTSPDILADLQTALDKRRDVTVKLINHRGPRGDPVAVELTVTPTRDAVGNVAFFRGTLRQCPPMAAHMAAVASRQRRMTAVVIVAGGGLAHEVAPPKDPYPPEACEEDDSGPAPRKRARGSDDALGTPTMPMAETMTVPANRNHLPASHLMECLIRNPSAPVMVRMMQLNNCARGSATGTLAAPAPSPRDPSGALLLRDPSGAYYSSDTCNTFTAAQAMQQLQMNMIQQSNAAMAPRSTGGCNTSNVGAPGVAAPSANISSIGKFGLELGAYATQHLTAATVLGAMLRPESQHYSAMQRPCTPQHTFFASSTPTQNAPTQSAPVESRQGEVGMLPPAPIVTFYRPAVAAAAPPPPECIASIEAAAAQFRRGARGSKELTEAVKQQGVISMGPLLGQGITAPSLIGPEMTLNASAEMHACRFTSEAGEGASDSVHGTVTTTSPGSSRSEGGSSSEGGFNSFYAPRNVAFALESGHQELTDHLERGSEGEQAHAVDEMIEALLGETYSPSLSTTSTSTGRVRIRSRGLLLCRAVQ